MVSTCYNRQLVFSLQLFIFLASVLVTQQCEDGWTAYNGHCYYASNEATWWQAARDWCVERGGDLTSILSQDEQNFTNNFLKKPTYTDLFWIGLNQLSDRITLKWSDGSGVEYTNWVSGYPLNDQLNLCTYLTSPAEEQLFSRYANNNKMKDVLLCPSCVDNVNTFYFGRFSRTYVPDECEARCFSQSQCYIYTFYSSAYPDDFWAGECVGISNETGVNFNEGDVFSGRRIDVPILDVSPTWQTTNCDIAKKFICKKPEQSTGPITTVPSTDAGYCPTGYYSLRGNKCFKVFQEHDVQAVNWTQALDICRSQPGLLPDLASISNKDEEDVIISQLREFGGGVWIGFAVITPGSNYYYWTDNSHIGYTNWMYLQPDNNYDEKCAAISTWVESWDAGLWYNDYCSALKGYVCQTYKDVNAPITTPPPTPFSCPSGYVAYWYACYRFFSAQVTWDEADQSCRNDGAYLSSIHSEPENKAIMLYASNEAQLPVWIGFKKNQDNEFVWTDDWPIRYTNWMLSEPSNDECVVMMPSGKWDAVPCTNESGYICKITEEAVPTTPPNVDGTCPLNWVAWGSDCYTFSKTVIDTVLTWGDGMAKCQELAGDEYVATLASVHSYMENKFIYDNFVEIGLTTDYVAAAYIGLTQDTVVQPFYWADGTILQYTNWAPGEPNRSPPNERQCGEMYLTKVWPAHWNDLPCNAYGNKLYVCKTPKVPPTTVPTVPTVVPASCPNSEWYRYDEWCYLFRPDEQVNWDTAWLTCDRGVGVESTLASIHDFDENWFIWQTMLNVTKYPTSFSCYIGLYKTGTGYPHRWLDGSEVDYTYWANGQPDDSGGVEHCVVMLHSEGQWADVPCTDLEGYVCKVALGTTYRYTDGEWRQKKMLL